MVDVTVPIEIALMRHTLKDIPVRVLSAGTSFSYALNVTWSWTDSANWAISAQADSLLTGYVLTVSDGVETLIVTVDSEIHVSSAMSNTAGTFTLTASFNGLASVTITAGEETHIVLFTLGGFGNNLVTIDGVTHGPYTLEQIREIFSIDLEID